MDALVFDILLFSSCTFAAICGGAPERMAAGMLLSAAFTSLILISGSGRFEHIEWGIAIVDLGLLLGLLALALKADRYWPLWLTALQFVTVWSHAGFLATASKVPWAYAVASTAWSFPMLAILAMGTQRHRKRLRHSNMERSWSE